MVKATRVLTDSITQNLKDAGCDDGFIARFKEIKDETAQKQIMLLQKQRAALLTELHKYQRKIECLDYLLYMMKNQ